jgi:hypothetical protein
MRIGTAAVAVDVAVATLVTMQNARVRIRSVDSSVPRAAIGTGWLSIARGYENRRDNACGDYSLNVP